MKTQTKLFIIISLISASHLYSDSPVNLCKEQKSKESCENFKVESKSICIWDNSNSKCKKDSENVADYREYDDVSFTKKDKKNQ